MKLSMKLTQSWVPAVSIVVGVLIGVLSIATCGPKKESAHAVRIGANMALSGPVSFWAESVLQGLQLATEDFNKANPATPVTIIAEDNQGDPKNAISAMRKLCTVDHVAAVVSVLTPFSKPLRPLAEELKTPLLGTVVASLNFGKENEWSFRDYPTPDQLGTLIAEHGYKAMRLRRVVSLVVDDEYGKDSQTLFKEKFVSLGGQVVASDTVTQKDTDVRAQVSKLLAAKPDAVFLVIRENTLGIAVRQLRELGFKGQILGINAFDSPVVWNTCGPAGEGVVFANVRIDYESNTSARAFAEAFRTRYGKTPNNTNAYGYSIGAYLLPLTVEAKGDSVKMKDLLASMQVDTLRGRIRMLPSRDVQTDVALYQHRGNQDVLIGN
jgi:branched-chain amino acid transport system substrate-binding protein